MTDDLQRIGAEQFDNSKIANSSSLKYKPEISYTGGTCHLKYVSMFSGIWQTSHVLFSLSVSSVCQFRFCFFHWWSSLLKRCFHSSEDLQEGMAAGETEHYLFVFISDSLCCSHAVKRASPMLWPKPQTVEPNDLSLSFPLMSSMSRGTTSTEPLR